MQRALCVCFILVCATVCIFADDKDDKYKRELQFEMQSKKVSVESNMRTGTSKDKLKFEFETDDQMYVRLQYASSATGTATMLKFKAYSIVEYEGTGAYTNTSVVKSTMLLNKWKPIACPKTVVNNATLYTCTAVTDNNVFAAQVQFTTDTINTNAVVMKPTSAKIGFNITSFPFQGTNTRLALIAKVVAGKAMEKKESAESEEKKQGFVKQKEKQVSLGSLAFFSWLESAICDNVDCSVANTPLQTESSGEEGEDRIVFSFLANRPTKIVWDPKLGVSDTSNATALFGASLLAVLFALLALLA